ISIGDNRSGGSADMTILRWRAIWRVFLGGDIGLAEAYRAGEWTTSDLTALLLWGMANETPLTASMDGWKGTRALHRIRHRLRDNTRPNSRQNISSHYDLGNQ